MTEAVGARGRYRCPFGPAPLQDFQPVFDNLVLARKTRFYHQTKTADVFGIHRAMAVSQARTVALRRAVARRVTRGIGT
jgi:hypothetical protein